MSGGGGFLAAPYGATLCQIRGDWAFYAAVFKFLAWSGAVSMRWQCRASSTIARLAFPDFAQNAGWWSTRWTHEEYMEHRRDANLFAPILLACCIGLRLDCIMVDVLHAVD